MDTPRHVAICLCELCERTGSGAFGPQPDGALPVQVVKSTRLAKGKPVGGEGHLSPGAQIMWGERGRGKVARVVALVPAGTPPDGTVPELRDIKRWRLKFRDPAVSRAKDHYLVSRKVERPRLGEILVYYLPSADHVRPLQGTR